MKKVFVLLFVLLASFNVCAQESADKQAGDSAALEALSFDNVISELASPEGVGEDGSVKKSRIENEFWYVIILSALCVVSLTVVLAFLTRLRQGTKPRDMVSAAGLILIVFGTIILVLIVDTSEQLTAAIGILGAIAGYLFRTAQEKEPQELPEREA